MRPPPPPAYGVHRGPRPHPVRPAVILAVLLAVVAVIGAGVAVSMNYAAQHARSTEYSAPDGTLGPAGQTAEPVPVTPPPAEATPTPVVEASGGPVTSADQAIDVVMKRADIREWMKQIEAAQAAGKQRKACVDVTEEQADAYIVHVYESVEDEDPPHTATFGWYRVSKADGAISDVNTP